MPERSIPVSVVIPCFQCVHTIGRALASVLQQTAHPAEVILVDDASRDGTLDALNSWQNRHPALIKVVALDENGGAGAARNAGWALATQPYVAFLDADDTWHPDKLMLQHTFMVTHPGIALSGHLCTEQSGGKRVQTNEGALAPRRILPIEWLFKNAFSTPSVMLRRDLPLRFTDGRRYCEDFLLWQQIAFSGHEVVRLEAPLAQLHKPIYGAGGLSGQLWKMEQGELANFVQLRRDGAIGWPLCLIATTFSLLKYARRWVLVRFRNRPSKQA